MHEADAQIAAVTRALQVHAIAIPEDVAAIPPQHPADDVDQSRFACAVGTRECMNLSGAYVERDVAKDWDSSEALGNGFNL